MTAKQIVDAPSASFMDAKESPQAHAQRLVGLQLDKHVARSRHLRNALRRHAAMLSPMARQAITSHLERDHELTIARINQASEIPDFEFPPRLDDWA